MTSIKSSHFCSSSASGKDWRDTSKNVLDNLDEARKDDSPYNFGFIYISDHLADDAVSIINLFKSVTNIENWIGSIGMGVIGGNQAYTDKPAISVMVGNFPEGSFCVFPKTGDLGENIPQDEVNTWLDNNAPLLTFVHGDPLSQQDPIQTLQNLANLTGGFLVGGMTSSRSEHYQIANTICENTITGAFFSDKIEVATTVSQGCRPISDFHTITKSDGNIILEIDGKKPFTVLQKVLREEAAKKLGKDPEHITTDFAPPDKDEFTINEASMGMSRGQIHVGLSLSNSDIKDYLTRNIIGIDAQEGSISISEDVSNGELLIFSERNNETIFNDLEAKLTTLKKRITEGKGKFKPKGAIYISCIARGFQTEPNDAVNEIDIIRKIIGPLPLCGFYAGGEISNARLYGYTGILTLFF
ncbi:MAG: FIST C-terminal domain-containing protein [Alphaproteobacteria bacterium]|nr:FIST C-terminal domain-containing protein [Alphaproteobacteria bacterium]